MLAMQNKSTGENDEAVEGSDIFLFEASGQVLLKGITPPFRLHFDVDKPVELTAVCSKLSLRVAIVFDSYMCMVPFGTVVSSRRNSIYTVVDRAQRAASMTARPAPHVANSVCMAQMLQM